MMGYAALESSMFVIYTSRSKRAPSPGIVVHIAGTSLQFERYQTPGGERVLACEVPDKAPELAALIRACRHHPEFAVAGQPLEPLIRAAETSAAATKLSLIESVRRLAIANGWDPVDLSGSGQHGDPAEGGGRSPRTGLTLAEAALCSPPTNWSETVHRSYPWHDPTWSAPHAGWIPPQVPRKQGAEVSGRTTEQAPDFGAPETVPPDAAEPPATEPASPTLEPEPEPQAFDPGPQPENADPAVAAGYPAEHVDAARTLALELAGKRGSTDYHPNALNFVLKRAGLPTVRKAVLTALLAPT